MENHQQKIQQVLDQFKNSDVDCNEVNVDELEQMGSNIAS